MKKNKIQLYLNNFRRLLSPYLKKDINFRTIVHPAENGAIIELKFITTAPVKDEFRKKEKSIVDALKKIDQHAFGGNLNGFTFKGTNYILEGEKVILIKDDSNSEWRINQAKEDVEKLVLPQNQQS